MNELLYQLGLFIVTSESVLCIRAGGGEGADPKRVGPVPADPGNVSVFSRDPDDGCLTPTGARWEAPHVMSAIV